jgi:hypothetical protein
MSAAGLQELEGPEFRGRQDRETFLTDLETQALPSSVKRLEELAPRRDH